MLSGGRWCRKIDRCVAYVGNWRYLKVVEEVDDCIDEIGGHYDYSSDEDQKNTC
jgi:hypothetical protein